MTHIEQAIAVLMPDLPDGPARQVELERRTAEIIKLVVPAVPLFCPKCGVRHVDAGEWATKVHRTHLCLACDHRWPVEPCVFGAVAQDGGCDGEGTA